MAFNVRIDQARRLVASTWHGPIGSADLIAYIDQVWVGGNVRGYSELIDFRRVDEVDIPTADIHHIANYSRRYDNPEKRVGSALVAVDQLIYGLSRMFASIRALESEDLREYRVFDAIEDAELWLATFDGLRLAGD